MMQINNNDNASAVVIVHLAYYYILSSPTLPSGPVHIVQNKNGKFAIYVSVCVCDAP